ncbi:WD repeat-containing protein 41 [Notothenia coriiceps]|uniref:WD repeat-containing protein 41 n=1 Tax=Notothenia coriiceps TaxID=8208 RepID=A0A6I9PD70_9TELE|nr:PREDICTED: WD repeat-containing protein 41 [Notothenia coriiceps]
MLRWILGGREAQGSLEKNSVLCIGEEQPKNWFTELQVLKGHFDIVRFLVQIDDFRRSSPTENIQSMTRAQSSPLCDCVCSTVYTKPFNAVRTHMHAHISPPLLCESMLHTSW